MFTGDVKVVHLDLFDNKRQRGIGQWVHEGDTLHLSLQYCKMTANRILLNHSFLWSPGYTPLGVSLSLTLYCVCVSMSSS